MSTHLKYRVKKHNGAHRFLPNFIKSVLDRVEGLSGPVDHATRTKNEDILCDVLVKCYGDTFTFLTVHSSRPTCLSKIAEFTNHQSKNMIAAAAAIGDVKALEMLLTTESANGWDKSPAFGFPIATAAYLGHVEVVKTILRRFDCQDLDHPYEHVFSSSMTKSLSRCMNKVTKLLAAFHPEYFSVVDCNIFRRWLIKAVQTEDVNVVKAILGLKHQGGVEMYALGLEVACEIGHMEIIRLFFKKDLLNINQRLEFRGRCGYESPLTIAVSSENVTAVETLLELGASVNGPRLFGCGRSAAMPPLDLAKHLQQHDIIRVLVNHGAKFKEPRGQPI